MSVDDPKGGGTGADDELNLDLTELSDEIIKRYSPERLLRSIKSRSGRGDALDWATRHHFERRLGVDLSDVRVFSGEMAKEVTRAKSAEALTVGTTKAILMGGSGDKSPATSRGRGLLAHELTHVAQDSRRLHPKSVGETTGPFTHEDEVEAERVAAEEEAAIHSGANTKTQSRRGLTEQEYLRILYESVFMRVLEIFNRDEEVRRIRVGGSRFRP